MALIPSVFRGETEINTPDTVDGVTPIMAAIFAQYDDADDMVRHCFAVVVKDDGGSTGTYREKWRVMNADLSAQDTNELTVAHPVLAGENVVILLPPRIATSAAASAGVAAGSAVNPSDAQLMANIFSSDGSFVSNSIADKFGPKIPRTTFNSDVGGARFFAETG